MQGSASYIRVLDTTHIYTDSIGNYYIYKTYD